MWEETDGLRTNKKSRVGSPGRDMVCLNPIQVKIHEGLTHKVGNRFHIVRCNIKGMNRHKERFGIQRFLVLYPNKAYESWAF